MVKQTKQWDGEHWRMTSMAVNTNVNANVKVNTNVKVFDGFDNSRFKITDRLGKWVNQHTPWFPLKLDGSDPHALVAAQSYADSVRRHSKMLSDDLTNTVKAARRRVERDFGGTNVKK